MDALTKGTEIVKYFSAVALPPADIDNEIAIQRGIKIPLSRITALGIGLEPVVAAVQQITGAVSGYYKVTLPAGGHLAAFKDGSGYLGTVLDSGGISGQARLNPLVCNPTMLFVAATLASIDKKLDKIHEVQQEMLDFLTQKEKSNLRGDLNFLGGVYSDYKYNWNNEKYKAANHIKVLDIRQNAGRSIDFHREQIKKHVGKPNLFHSDQDVKKQLGTVSDSFKEYQLALYLYSFGYFLEVLLQENFAGEYLGSIIEKLEDAAFQYRELYTEVYAKIEGYTKTSLQSQFFSGLSAIHKMAGETIAKIPVIGGTQLDELLIDSGLRLGTYGDQLAKENMRQLIDKQSSHVRPFIENISTISQLYNNPLTVVFSDSDVYMDIEG